jgi:hypothetical protein
VAGGARAAPSAAAGSIARVAGTIRGFQGKDGQSAVQIREFRDPKNAGIEALERLRDKAAATIAYLE